MHHSSTFLAPLWIRDLRGAHGQGPAVMYVAANSQVAHSCCVADQGPDPEDSETLTDWFGLWAFAFRGLDGLHQKHQKGTKRHQGSDRGPAEPERLLCVVGVAVSRSWSTPTRTLHQIISAWPGLPAHCPLVDRLWETIAQCLASAGSSDTGGPTPYRRGCGWDVDTTARDAET